MTGPCPCVLGFRLSTKTVSVLICIYLAETILTNPFPLHIFTQAGFVACRKGASVDKYSDLKEVIEGIRLDGLQIWTLLEPEKGWDKRVKEQKAANKMVQNLLVLVKDPGNNVKSIGIGHLRAGKTVSCLGRGNHGKKVDTNPGYGYKAPHVNMQRAILAKYSSNPVTKAKRMASRAARTPDEVAASLTKFRATWAARTPDEVAASLAKWHATYAARTPEANAASLAKWHATTHATEQRNRDAGILNYPFKLHAIRAFPNTISGGYDGIGLLLLNLLGFLEPNQAVMVDSNSTIGSSPLLSQDRAECKYTTVFNNREVSHKSYPDAKFQVRTVRQQNLLQHYGYGRPAIGDDVVVEFKCFAMWGWRTSGSSYNGPSYGPLNDVAKQTQLPARHVPMFVNCLHHGFLLMGLAPPGSEAVWQINAMFVFPTNKVWPLFARFSTYPPHPVAQITHSPIISFPMFAYPDK